MNVLVIDDSETHRTLIGQVVLSVGHTPILLEDGFNVVDTIKRYQAKMVLLDLVMPNIDGYKVCREIRKNPETNTVPVIMVSSKSTDTDKAWGMRQGATAYVTKPIDPTELAGLIKNTL